MTKYVFTFISLSFVLLIISSGCERVANPCLEPRRYLLNLRTFKPADTGSVGVDSVLPSAVVGFIDTNILFFDTVQSSSFRGPLSAIADSARWFIIPDTSDLSGRDTLTFYYERKPVFLSTACGYTYVYALADILFTTNRIDSARIENAEVTNNTEITHVKVFY